MPFLRLFLLGCLSAILPCSGFSDTRFQTLFITDGVQTVYRLKHNLLVVGTDSVFADGLSLDRSQYILDYEQGVLILSRRFPRWTPVRVSYRCIPFSGQISGYRLHRIMKPSAESADTTHVIARINSSVWSAGKDINLSGSKSVGFSVGGIEGSGINQSTRVSITGQIEGVGIEAELSDQSSPIPPEGTTRDIEELDKMVINLRGKKWDGSFGDVDLKLGAQGFGTVERRAVGGLVNVQTGPAEFALGYARPKGQFGRVIFDGKDGVQGPYVLAPDGRVAQLVPGSEDVYLDGIRMIRGWDADYTIDYSTGELVFTNRRIIDRESRIEASFQYVTNAYERNDLAGSAGFHFGGLQCGVGVFREGDDQNRSYQEELTEEEKRYLAGIGSDSSLAWVEGGEYVGDRSGSYCRAGDHYIYVGQNSGDYQVRFTFLGDSLGDYVYDDTLAYWFVGEGTGDYVARIRIALPERQELVNVSTEFSQGGLTASGSGVFQHRIHNLFAQDGASEQNGAFGVKLGWTDEHYRISYHAKHHGQGFYFPSADSIVGFEQRWDGTGINKLKTSNEFVFTARPVDSVEVSGEAGVLEKINGDAVDRYRGTARVWWFEGEAGRAGTENRQKLSMTPRIKWFMPKAGLTMVSRPEEWTRVLSTGFGVYPIENLNAGLDCRLYQTDKPDSTEKIQKAEQGNLTQANIVWNPGDVFRFEAQLGKQNRHYLQARGQDWTQWLGNITTVAAPATGIRIQADFNQSYHLVQLKDEVFRYVGPGNGEYSQDSITHRYYYNPHGDYERVVVAKGRFTSAMERSITAAGEVSNLKPVVLTGSYSCASTGTDTTSLQDFRNYNFRFTLRALEPVLTGYLGTNGASSLDRTLAVTGKRFKRFQHYLEVLTSRVPELELRIRLENSSQVADYTESAWKMELNPVVKAWLKLEFILGVECSVVQEPESYPGPRRFSLLAKEGRVLRDWSIGDRTRLRGSIGIVQRSASVAELPFEVGLNEPLGWTPSASSGINYLISDILTALITYRFSDRPDRPSEHQLNGELKAYF